MSPIRSHDPPGLFSATPSIAPANLTDEIDVPRIEREEMRFLTPDQVATLADTIDDPYGPLVLVGAYCGLRLGELAGLRRGRIDFLARTIDVVEIVTEAGGRLHEGPPKARAGRRTVPMPRHVAESLETACGSIGQEALVFAGERGAALRGSAFRRRVWQPAVKRAGLAPLRPHDLRHTAVAFWIAAGAQPLEVARRAGHTSVVVVFDRYGHLLPRDDDPVTDALDELAAGAKPKRSATVRAIDVRSHGPARAGKIAADQGGRGGTRTPDICLVRAAL
jgi:integrase